MKQKSDLRLEFRGYVQAPRGDNRIALPNSAEKEASGPSSRFKNAIRLRKDIFTYEFFCGSSLDLVVSKLESSSVRF